MLGGEEAVLGEMRLHHRVEAACQRLGARVIVVAAEQLDDARLGRPERQLAGRAREPLLYPCLCQRLARQPVPRRVVAVGEIDEDRVAVGEDNGLAGVAVLDHRHLAHRILCEEVGPLLRLIDQVDVDGFHRQPQQREEQLDAMRMAGERKAIEADRAHGSRHVGLRG
jgi:hypothetical protein